MWGLFLPPGAAEPFMATCASHGLSGLLRCFQSSLEAAREGMAESLQVGANSSYLGKSWSDPQLFPIVLLAGLEEFLTTYLSPSCPPAGGHLSVLCCQG